jgi:hypothetical protein
MAAARRPAFETGRASTREDVEGNAPARVALRERFLVVPELSFDDEDQLAYDVAHEHRLEVSDLRGRASGCRAGSAAAPSSR